MRLKPKIIILQKSIALSARSFFLLGILFVNLSFQNCFAANTNSKELSKISKKSKPSDTAKNSEKKILFQSSEAKYVYVKKPQVNLRVGPSMNSPIALKIFGRGEPLQMLATFYQWVKVKTIEGVEGWVQQPMISKVNRYAVVISSSVEDFIFAHALDNKYSRKVMKIENQVRVQVKKCTSDNWCKVRTSGRWGWVEKKNLWGI